MWNAYTGREPRPLWRSARPLLETRPMLSLRPLTARLAGKVRPARRFDWDGYPSEELYPATVLERSAAVALEADYDRIRGTIPDCDLADWIAEARGGPQPQPPTRRFDLGRALVADGTVYYGGGYEPLVKGLPPLVARGAPERLGEAQLASYGLTEEFFGHWLIDGSLLVLLAERMGVTALSPLTPGMTQWAHRPGYAAMLDSPVVAPRLATVDKLWGVDDLARNPGRAARLRELRSRVRAGAAPGESPRRLYVSRGLAGVRRHLRNEQAIGELLEAQYGFTVIDPFQLEPRALAGMFREADIVLGVEGSHMFHALAAAPERALIFQIMPATRFCIAAKWFTDMIGMRYGFTVADPEDEGFVLPPDRLHRVMELIERATN